MNTKLNLTLGAAAAALLAATSISLAADAVFEAPPAPPAAPIVSAPINTWEGGYAGISLGYGFSGEADFDGDLVGTADTDGFVGNVFGGWNWQSGSFVYGIEGDVGYNGMEDDDAGVNVEHGIDGSLRARLGVAATENVLVYATAGGAGSRVEVDAPVAGGVGSDSATLWGWTAGVGTDVKFTEQAFGRLEYRYTDLGDETFDFGGGVSADVGSTSHKVLVGVGMKF